MIGYEPSTHSLTVVQLVPLQYDVQLSPGLSKECDREGGKEQGQTADITLIDRATSQIASLCRLGAHAETTTSATAIAFIEKLEIAKRSYLRIPVQIIEMRVGRTSAKAYSFSSLATGVRMTWVANIRKGAI